MKKIFIYLFVLIGCNAIKNLSDIQGVYTCGYQNEFYTVHDTLILKNINTDVYQIERRTGVDQKIKNEKWTLTYDDEKNMLTEIKKGKFVVVLNGDLVYGNRTYKKIK